MITEIVLRGFRGIPDERRFALRQITFLSGRNGLGKTTFFDAIDWCLFGSASRLGDDIDSIRNLYSDASSPSVELAISLGDKDVRIKRALDGTFPRLFIDGNQTLDRDLLDLFVTDRLVFPPHSQDTASRVRGLVYLEQAQIRSLVSAETEDVRTELFQALLGIPHVSTVRASLRKIADSLEARLRQTAQELEQLDIDLADSNLATAQDMSSEIERLSAEIQTRALEVLGAQSPAARTDLELQSMSRAALLTIRERRRKLEDALSAVDRLEEESRHYTAEIELRRRTLAEVERSASEGRQQYAVARVNRETAERQLQEARQRRDAASRTLEAARRQATRRASLVRLQAEVADRRAATADAERLRNSLEVQLAAAKSKSAEQDELVLALRRRLAALSARNERRGRLSALDAERLTLERRLNERRATFQQQNSLISNLRALVENARLEQDSAAASHAASIAGLEARDRAASLTLELRRLATELGLTECPTCGTAFDSNQDLLDHIDHTQERHTESSQQAAAARRRLDDAKEHQDSLQSRLLGAEGSLAELQGDIRSLESRLAELDGERSRLTAQDTHMRDEPSDTTLTQQLGQSEHAASEAIAIRRALEAEAATADERLSLTTSDLADAERRLAELQDEAQRMATTDLPQPETLEQQLQTELRNVDQCQEAAEEAAHLERQAEEAQADSLARVEAARSAVRRAEGRLQMISTELVETIQSATGRNGDRLAITLALEELSTKEEALRVLLERIDELLNAEAQSAALQRLKYLQATKQSALLELRGLERANARFSSVAAGLVARANAEECDALVQQRSAIQECVRALLPHKHLDEIDIDPESGAILITDYLLQRDSRKVKAYQYLSTGQANALAVSMFVGIALRQRIALFDFLLMDEPVQNLDDVHFLAFISLIKRVALDRQVVFSTADGNIAEIFRRQMKSTWHRYPHDYIEYEWQEFAPLQGPTVIPRA